MSSKFTGADYLKKEQDFSTAKKSLHSKIDRKAIEFLKNVKKEKRAKSGVALKVKVNKVDHVPSQTLMIVCAVLSPDLMDQLSLEQVKILAKEFDVKLDKNGEDCIVTGSWNMIEKLKENLDRLKDANKESVVVDADEDVTSVQGKDISENDACMASVQKTIPFEINGIKIEAEVDTIDYSMDSTRDTSILENSVDEMNSSIDITQKKQKCVNPNDEDLYENETAECSITEAFMEYVKHGKYDSRNMIEICPKKGQSLRVLEKNPELASSVCSICGYRSSKEGVTRHMQRRHSKITYKCEVCFSVFGVRYDMRRHRLCHFDKNGKLNKKGKRVWDECHHDIDSELVHYKDFEENFEKEKVTKRKRKSANDADIEQSDEEQEESQEEKGKEIADKSQPRYPPKDTSRANCPICDKNYPLKVLPVHMKVHREKVILNCELCPKQFTDRAKLNVHRRSAHFEKYKCDICSLVLSGSTALNNHIAGKHGQKVKCQVCLKDFATPNSLNTHHKREHENLRHFSCDICQKTFYDKRGMENHRVTHFDAETKDSLKKYVCSFCPKRFLVKHTLKMHENTHTGNKPYKCTYEGCLKAFPYSSMLNKHLKVHTDEKKFQCQYCDKAFKFPYKLRHHTILHTRSRENACEQCGKLFTTSTTLKMHNCKPMNLIMGENEVVVKSISGESLISLEALEERIKTEQQEDTIYVCGFCEESFLDISLINSHIQAYHTSAAAAPEPSTPDQHVYYVDDQTTNNQHLLVDGAVTEFLVEGHTSVDLDISRNNEELAHVDTEAKRDGLGQVEVVKHGQEFFQIVDTVNMKDEQVKIHMDPDIDNVIKSIEIREEKEMEIAEIKK